MSLQSLIATGTKVWLDGVEPEDVKKNRALGITGATSNPIIISDILKKGHFDDRMTDLIEQGLDDETIAWKLDDDLVKSAQQVFLPVWEQTKGDNGYVSFELDPLLEDEQKPIPHAERVRRYIELGKKWSAGHKNRMIKVPATPAGLDALEELAAAGVTINVTLTFSERQYKIARENVWRGAQRRKDGLQQFKSVYSIFISRIDVYTEKHVPELSPAAQGQVGLVNVKRIWRMNQDFWRDKNLRLHQELVFASTGVKKPTDPPDKYVEALAGSDIQTNPTATNEAVQKLNKQYTRKIDQMPPESVLREIDQKVDMDKMERVLMEEGTRKFSDPQHALLKLIGEKRAQLAPAK
ncbi:MAG TPA: transaldolase family protein [Tepidisphaeraceae bacterium]|nr:transaldolase family protein [Tepidisphaeraceae bacterium]